MWSGNAVGPHVCQCLLFAIPYKTVPSSSSNPVLYHSGISQDCLWNNLGSVFAVGYLLPGLIQHLPRHGMWWNSQTSSRVKRGVFAVLHWENGLDFFTFPERMVWFGFFWYSGSKIPELLGRSFWSFNLKLDTLLFVGSWWLRVLLLVIRDGNKNFILRFYLIADSLSRISLSDPFRNLTPWREAGAAS